MFCHSAQTFATTIAGQQQALHLMLVKTTHILLTILPELKVNVLREGEVLAPKEYQMLRIQFNVICTELALS